VLQEWDRYWSTINGNGTIVWGPDPELTDLGIKQAEAANAMWREHTKLGLPTPDVIYTSPFRRSIHTSIITFNGWFHPDGTEPGTEASKSVLTIVIEVRLIYFFQFLKGLIIDTRISTKQVESIPAI